MTWEELIYQMNQIPENRRNEKAVFVVDGEDAWEIDALDYNKRDGTGGFVTHQDLEQNGIYDDKFEDYDEKTIPPITLTP